MADKFTREQELLKKLRDDKCDGNAAELARQLKLDATYVNRLFYPIGKTGRKGIGLKVMRKASEVFKLPVGYWEGADGATSPPPTGAKKGDFVEALTDEEREMLRHFRHLWPSDRKAKIKEIAELGREREAQKKELFDEAGVTGIMERAANAARRQTSAISVDPADPSLKQKPLPGLE